MTKSLDSKLVVLLSLPGLFMAFATVFFIPSRIEPAFWLPIFIFCAIVIARAGVPKPFLHGFLVSLVNCVWITSAHILFAGTYLANHVEEAEMLKTMPSPDSPRLMMAMTGPAVGIASGLVLGLFSYVAAKLVKPKAAP
ncbi:MAG TPA: hypothetical protein VF103_00955 [Polyangiaceae bacterium]